MKLACIDLEGVLTPELWPKIAMHTGIEELWVTTREIPDYHIIMRQRIASLRNHRVTLETIQTILHTVQPFSEAADFLKALAAKGYRIDIVSDCFLELAENLVRDLGGPAIFCHRLITDEDGLVCGYHLFPRRGKEDHVENAQNEGMQVLAVGDAFNDLTMLRRADIGFLINPSLATQDAAPDLRTVNKLNEILAQIP